MKATSVPADKSIPNYSEFPEQLLRIADAEHPVRYSVTRVTEAPLLVN